MLFGRRPASAKIIAGLGNPGAKYRNTRHNVGFEALDRLAERLGAPFDREKRSALVASARHNGQRLLLLKPMTFMNRSGQAVAAHARNGVDELSDLMVVVDDVHLPLGKLRLRREGSAGGHNGLKSIIERVGGPGFPRLRIGVGAAGPGGELIDHVLGSFRPEEREAVDEALDRAVDALLTYVEDGIDRAMDRFN